jgi:hypothetical protein
VAVKREALAYGSKSMRLLLLALQAASLIAAWALLHPERSGMLKLSLIYVFVVWVIAGVITFGSYLAFSMEPFSDLLIVAARASANAMWLVPGILALTTRSPWLQAAGVAVIMNTTRLLALSRPPRGKAPARRYRLKPVGGEDDDKLVLHARETDHFSPETLPAMAGGLALQAGIYALYQSYPLSAAASFAAVTVLWVSTSLTHGALLARRVAKVLYAAPVVLLTLLLTFTFAAVLMQATVGTEPPPAVAAAGPLDLPPPPPGTTSRVLERIAHVPPLPRPVPAPSGANGPQKIVTEMVDPAPAASIEKTMKGIPGVILRPRPVKAEKPPMVLAGARFHFTAGRQSLAFPFSGEYELFRLSSVSLPRGSTLETGSPLEAIFGTTNGEPMQTVAVQPFDPPLDLTNCGKVLVTVINAEKYPVLVMMQLVTESSVEDGGSDLLGMKGAGEQMLEFQVPPATRPLLVRGLRIAFQRPVTDNNTNVRIAVKGFTLLTRGF